MARPIDKILSYNLKDGIFDNKCGYFIDKNNPQDLNSTKLEIRLLSTCSPRILFRGFWFNKIEELSFVQGNNIITSLKYYLDA